MRNSYLTIDKCWHLKVITGDQAPLPNKWIRVKVKCAGVCGGDIKNLAIGREAPFCHEYYGTIVESTSNIFSVGENVVGYNCIACGVCEQCSSGIFKECHDKWYLTEPAAAEFIDIPYFAVYPTVLEPKQAVLIEPVAAAISNFLCLNLDYSQASVAVLGRGPLAAIADRWLETKGFKKADRPDIVWLYSESLLNHAVDLVNPSGKIFVCYSPTDFVLKEKVLKQARNNLVSFTIVVASPNECFHEAETFIQSQHENIENIIGVHASLKSPENVVECILLNRHNRKKTLIF
jgi:hypothetical protein